ncbi:unnamed protein product [Sphagnum balticum]
MVARPRHGIRYPGPCRALCASAPSSVCQERVQLQRRWQYPDSQVQPIKPKHSRHAVVHAVEHREVNTSSYQYRFSVLTSLTSQMRGCGCTVAMAQLEK